MHTTVKYAHRKTYYTDWRCAYEIDIYMSVLDIWTKQITQVGDTEIQKILSSVQKYSHEINQIIQVGGTENLEI